MVFWLYTGSGLYRDIFEAIEKYFVKLVVNTSGSVRPIFPAGSISGSGAHWFFAIASTLCVDRYLVKRGMISLWTHLACSCCPPGECAASCGSTHPCPSLPGNNRELLLARTRSYKKDGEPLLNLTGAMSRCSREKKCTQKRELESPL